MEYKQLLKMIVAMCIVQLEGKESSNATWYLTYSLQQPAEKTTFEKHLISTQNWIWGILLTNIWASKIGWLFQHSKGGELIPYQNTTNGMQYFLSYIRCMYEIYIKILFSVETCENLSVKVFVCGPISYFCDSYYILITNEGFC